MTFCVVFSFFFRIFTPDISFKKMRKKLNTFSQFAQSLYPHELEYLLVVQNFSKPENLNILKQIHRNSTSQTQKPFDANEDKRTYSYLKNWITDTLSKIDVDMFFEWLIATEKKVLTDIIVPNDEVVLLANMKKIETTDYNFIRFYELSQYYRDYLLVRNRKKYNKIVIEFLNKYHDQYHYLKKINQELDEVTAEIVKKEVFLKNESETFEKFLKNVYYDESLDGYTRYRAVVRLTIFYYNNRQFEEQYKVYVHLDEMLKTPLFYSRRILANYYANRAMMHSKLNQLSQAEKFGYLSIQSNNSDYLFYLINLCGVLLKEGKNAEALKLMRKSMPELKNTNNNYYKIGFASYLIRTLIYNGQGDRAVEYATHYFDAHKKEIFEHRWHLFLREYIHALIIQEKYTKVISLCKRYKLIAKEKNRIERIDYLPIIQSYYYLAEFMENVISEGKLISNIIKITRDLMLDKYQSQRIGELLDEIAPVIPEEIKIIRRELSAEK